VDVVVIGAGVAGLAAAERLAAAGRSVVLLEARERIGGRILTLRDARVAYPIELSAEWLDPGGLARRLIESAGWPFVGSKGRRWRRDQGLLPLSRLYDPALLRRLKRLGRRDRPVARALEQCCSAARWDADRAALVNYISGFHAADPASLSLRWFTEVESTQSAEVSASRSPAGADRIVAALQAKLGSRSEIHLRTVVREVRWRRGKVRIRAERDAEAVRFEAAKLLVTLPLSLLKPPTRKPGRVRFIPALTSKQRALDQLGMGNVCKVILSFARPFWKEHHPFQDLLMLHCPDQPFPTWWTMRPAEAPLLAGWVGGPQVQRLGKARGAARLELALDSLASALGLPRREFEPLLSGWWTHDWLEDPFARGAYSHVLSGGINAWQSLARALERTLFFAGEATCGHGYNATVDGAIASGHRAAEELLEE